MKDHVYRKYPDHVEAIQKLRNKDATFDEICNDYEEMCTWLAVQSCSLDPHCLECTDAREIIRDLENEIIEKLGRNQ